MAAREPEHVRAIALAHKILADPAEDMDSPAAVLARQFLRAQSLLDLPVTRHASALLSAVEALADTAEALALIEAVAALLHTAREAGRYQPASPERLAKVRETLRQIRKGT